MAEFMNQHRDRSHQKPAKQGLHPCRAVGFQSASKQGAVHPEKPMNEDGEIKKSESNHIVLMERRPMAETSGISLLATKENASRVGGRHVSLWS
jgi:hypothetical protein